MTNDSTLRIFSVPGCEPCDQVHEALATQNFDVLGVDGEIAIEQLNLEDDENFKLLDEVGFDSIPTAFIGVKQCKIFIDEETQKVTFDCRDGPSDDDEEDDDEEGIEVVAGYVPLDGDGR